MSYRPKGKHVTIDENNPEALGICDYSNMVFKRKDLVRQMEYRGQGLVWTGFMVGRPYLDKPNPQLKPPILPPDPIPVIDPRLPQPTELTWSTTFSTWNNTYGIWNTFDDLFDGSIALTPQQRLTGLQNINWNS